MNTNMSTILPLALVHVSGRRVSWSTDPTWYPKGKARGPEYSAAKRTGRAGQSRERADKVITRLLSSGTVRGVLVTGDLGPRAAWVTRSDVGLYRTAWCETDRSEGWWPTLEATGPAYAAARLTGAAGVVYGLDPLREVLAGSIVQERDWRTELAQAQARAAARVPAVPTLEDRARADLAQAKASSASGVHARVSARARRVG